MVVYGVGIKIYVVRFVDQLFELDVYDEIFFDLIDVNLVIQFIGLVLNNIIWVVYLYWLNQVVIGLNYCMNIIQWFVI